MEMENTFEVAAPAERVYAFLLDPNKVALCLPGAELGDQVDPDTFKGRVKIKVGPITVAYSGTAKISARDEAALRAELDAEGRETTGPGSARAHAVMTVERIEAGARVVIHTDYSVAGRVAQFGRGVMEDVSRRLVGQMADCIKAHLEHEDAHAAATEAGEEPPHLEPPPAAKPVNAIALMFSVLWERIRRLFVRGHPA